jgi:cellulose synthase/poly-beta-1,6-N-acetylglucosamine synthase-like glycosyltransferase
VFSKRILSFDGVKSRAAATPRPDPAPHGPGRASSERAIARDRVNDGATDDAAEAAFALDTAVNGLRRHRPDLSAGEPTWPWQKAALGVILALGLVMAIAAPDRFVFLLAAVLVLPFFCVVTLRAAALWHTLGRRRGVPQPAGAEMDPARLPRYSLLIPLYDEAAIVADLVDALGAIDYPETALEILLIVEEADQTTRHAIETARRPAPTRVIVVPEGRPRTKPRALNYALHYATGDLVVVYDAEDMPEPSQLRRAAALLSETPGLGCVQARLNVLNAEETWLTRQFAVEYTAQFDCLLPTLERLSLPVPLGGTSNHFPRAVLDEVGGWDPFNVTEDADLGIRLARLGWTVKVLDSTTWEEAPAVFSIWLKQRTRWLKGWMQTYLVHMRRPRETARDLGLLRFFGLQVLMGGLILSALVHPWFYVLAGLELAIGPLTPPQDDALANAVKVIGLINLVSGYLTGVALGYVAVAGRRRRTLAAWALMMPAYWLLISLAAYRALFQLVSSPYSWEKTRHRPRAAFTAPAPAE